MDPPRTAGPARVKFYGADWLPISALPKDKKGDVTGTDGRNLRHFSPGLNDVREKILWASTWRTTRVDDVAYSLLGIFDVSMPIAYGGGKRAFHRLMEVVVNDCREWETFAWAGPHSPRAPSFPESPSGYLALSGAPAELLRNSTSLAHRLRDVRIGYPFSLLDDEERNRDQDCLGRDNAPHPSRANHRDHPLSSHSQPWL